MSEHLRRFLEDECGGSLCDNTWGCIHDVVRDEISRLRAECALLLKERNIGVEKQESLIAERKKDHETMRRVKDCLDAVGHSKCFDLLQARLEAGDE